MGMTSLNVMAGVTLIACAIAVQVVVSLPSSMFSPSVLNSFIQGDGFLPYAALTPPTLELLGALKADDMYGMVTPKGYTLSEYNVKTSDGYTLRTFRIKNGRVPDSADSNRVRPPVLLLHGISLSSTSWVVHAPNESLAFILADAGYDVWMMNTRGNTFARKNDFYSDKDPKFWKFSLDEFMKIDLPDTVDYILKLTGFQQLAGFAGHSQGCSIVLGALTLNPGLNNKIGLVFALGPSIYVKFATTPLLSAYSELTPTGVQKSTSDALKGAEPSEFIPFDHDIQTRIPAGACQSVLLLSQCRNFVEAMFGQSVNINTQEYRRVFQQWPSSTSTWNLIQWAQLTNAPTPRFMMFNQGPELDLRKITARVILVTGGNDQIAAPRDAALSRQRLTEGGSFVEELNIVDYAHMDFIWDKNAGIRIYVVILDRLNAYTRLYFPGF